MLTWAIYGHMGATACKSRALGPSGLGAGGNAMAVVSMAEWAINPLLRQESFCIIGAKELFSIVIKSLATGHPR